MTVQPLGLLDRFLNRQHRRVVDVEKALDLSAQRFVEPKAWGLDPWATILQEGRGVARPFNSAALRNLAQSEWARMCIETVINDVTSIDWHITGREKGDKPSAKDVQDATQFLNDANENQTTLRQMLEMILADMLEIGDGVMVKTLDGRGRLSQLGAYDAETFFVSPDVHGIVRDYYQYPRSSATGTIINPRSTNSAPFGDPIHFPAEEIAWFAKSPRAYRHYGLGPVETLSQRLQLLLITVNQETLYFKEGSIPPGLLALDKDMTTEQYEEFRAMWAAEVKGKPHKMPMVRAQAQYIPFGYNYQQLQFLDRQVWYQKLTCAVFGVPPAYLGLAAETTNRATDVSQTANYKRKTVRPLLDSLEGIINQRVVWPHLGKHLRFEFKPSLDIAERQALASIHETRLRSAVVTINEVRAEDGLDPVPWGNEPYPPSYAASPITEPDAPRDEDEKRDDTADGKPPREAGAQAGASPEPVEAKSA